MGLGATKMTSPAAQQLVEELIKREKVVIFSKTYCPYCTMAKEAFAKIKVSPHTVELDKRGDGGDIQNVLGQMTGASSVPRVFVNGKFIGGGTDVKKLQDQGKLQPLVQAEH